MITDLFPFPSIVDGQRRDGSMFHWPDMCDRCRDRICATSPEEEILTCSYGFDFVRLDKKIVIAGMLIKDSPTITKAKARRFKAYPQNVIRRGGFNSAIRSLKEALKAEVGSIQEEKEKLILDYVNKDQYKIDFLEKLRPDILKGLSFVHDYKQINTQISNNINVIIEGRYAGTSIEDKIDKATAEEKAIYYAAKFLEEKLNVAKFLLQPEWLDKQELCKPSRFHGVVLKYRRIYTPRFDAKHLVIDLPGRSVQEVIANPQALSVIPHTLIDNAAKYSPEGGRILISTNDIEDGIEFSVSSYGPKLHEHERQKLFTPFYRGERARRLQEEGAGYGLYISQLIAKQHLGTEITFEQNRHQDEHYWTTFSILIPLKARIIW